MVIKLLKDKEKNLGTSQKKIIPSHNENDSRFFTRKDGDKEAVTQYFSDTKRKELSTQNLILMKIPLRNEGKSTHSQINNLYRPGKLKSTKC